MKLPEGLTRSVSMKVWQVKKQSPHIFFAAGVVGVVGSAVLACKATLKLEETLDEIKTDIEHVKTQDVVAVTDQERNRVLAVKYARGAVEIGRLYAPAIGLGAASLAALTGSHIQMTRRNAAVSAALTMVSKAYDDYRERVKVEIGEDKELDIYRGITTEEKTIDGKKTKVKVLDPDRRSPYARIFDASSIYWKKNNELNMMFLKCQQEHMNVRLRVYGVVLLNDVYDALGFDRTRQGAIVGWVRNDDDDRCEGDGYIDFGIYDWGNAQFVNGSENNVILDFNVDGVVYDKM